MKGDIMDAVMTVLFIGAGAGWMLLLMMVVNFPKWAAFVIGAPLGWGTVMGALCLFAGGWKKK